MFQCLRSNCIICRCGKICASLNFEITLGSGQSFHLTINSHFTGCEDGGIRSVKTVRPMDSGACSIHTGIKFRTNLSICSPEIQPRLPIQHLWTLDTSPLRALLVESTKKGCKCGPTLLIRWRLKINFRSA